MFANICGASMMVVSTDKCRTVWFQFVLMHRKRVVERSKGIDSVDSAVWKANIQHYQMELLQAYSTVMMKIFYSFQLQYAVVL